MEVCTEKVLCPCQINPGGITKVSYSLSAIIEQSTGSCSRTESTLTMKSVSFSFEMLFHILARLTRCMILQYNLDIFSLRIILHHKQLFLLSDL